MINTYKTAHARALITIPIIPYVNSTASWNCSFPTAVYGAQQSTNPYVHPNRENCGNSISSSGTQLLDTASQLQVAGADVATTFVSTGELQSTVSLAAGTTAIAVGVINPNAEQKSPVVRRLPVQVSP